MHEMQLPLPSAYDRPFNPPVSGVSLLMRGATVVGGAAVVGELQHENGSFAGVGISPLQVGVIR